MKTRATLLTATFTLAVAVVQLFRTEEYNHPEFAGGDATNGTAYAYPPAVGILSTAKNCLSCHVNNGEWKDDSGTIIDILDRDTKQSLRQNDGSFRIDVKRHEARTVLTVIGRKRDGTAPAPYRNAWLYVDPATIESPALSKFPPNWEVNLPMSCRVVGDQLAGYENADITSLPMTVRPAEGARDTEILLQAMLTRGEAVKGNTKEGMLGSYFERKVRLVVK
jgi:hypothetical protein